jgi:hypothetical protein
VALARWVVIRNITPTPELRVLRLRHFARLNVRRKALVEIHHDRKRRPNRDSQQQNRKHCERRKHAPPLPVLFRTLSAVVPHPVQLENEVRHGGEVEDDDARVPDARLPADEEGGEDEDHDYDGQRCDGEGLLRGSAALDDDEELYGKA